MDEPKGTKFVAYDTQGSVYDLWFTERKGLIHAGIRIVDEHGKRVKHIQKGLYRHSNRRILKSDDPKAP